MAGERPPRVLSIPAGAPFLPTLADSLMTGGVIPGFPAGDDPLALAAATIYVPTRRAARELRSILATRGDARSAILPTIRPLGEFEDDAALFDADPSLALDLAPPIDPVDRLLLLAPLVQRWKSRLPAHLAQLYAEDVVVPASTADAIWFARDLAKLMDDIETEGADWARLAGLAGGDLAQWWQVTLEFLSIVTQAWPDLLAEMDRSNPGAHRNALIDAEAARLVRSPPDGPVIAAGSTGSIPATARLLSAIARLPQGAVVLPGLDTHLDEATWAKVGGAALDPAGFGHPQAGLRKLIATIGVVRRDVVELGATEPALAARQLIVSEALRPADTTDAWAANRPAIEQAMKAGGLDGVSLIEAANERDEAAAIAIALRQAVDRPDSMAALVTGDRNLARRVSAELARFGIRADDSGGAPLARTQPATLFRLILETAFKPGNPIAIVSLLKHPLMRLGRRRADLRAAMELVEIAALRGRTGRPDVTRSAVLFDEALTIEEGDRKPAWLDGLSAARLENAQAALADLAAAFAPLAALRDEPETDLRTVLTASISAFEACGRDEDGALLDLYRGDAGEALAQFLRALMAAQATLAMAPAEWPDIAFALIAPETVKPKAGSDPRIHIWGALEARLQTVDTLILGGLNEGTFPSRAKGDAFLSRGMKGELDLEPPERRIGQAAHDFAMAMGSPTIILSRSARAGDAPSTPSRWLQRLTTVVGEDAADRMRERGATCLAWAQALDAAETLPYAKRPEPKPPVDARPKRFSVTEIETLRRDPYAIYARRVLGLRPVEPLLRDPNARERGSLFHAILHAFSQAVTDPFSPGAEAMLLDAGRRLFADAELPGDIHAVWWPRFEAMVPGMVEWERKRPHGISARLSETSAFETPVGDTGATLRARADRIDLLPAGMADILDYKTGSSPSVKQAHTLVAPQLALEAALLARGSFADAGTRKPANLAYVRLKGSGEVKEESILEHAKALKSAPEVAADAWRRLVALIERYGNPEAGYLSRALPFKEGDMDGDYDHLARVLEWSAGGESGDGEDGG